MSEIFDVREITATDVGLLMGGKNRENQQMDPIKWSLLYQEIKFQKNG